jgi:hypothetical protein
VCLDTPFDETAHTERKLAFAERFASSLRSRTLAVLDQQRTALSNRHHYSSSKLGHPWVAASIIVLASVLPYSIRLKLQSTHEPSALIRPPPLAGACSINVRWTGVQRG